MKKIEQSKPIRYAVQMRAPADEALDNINNNFVEYSCKLDKIGNGLATSLAHALFTARNYNGELYVDYGEGLVPFEYKWGK